MFYEFKIYPVGSKPESVVLFGENEEDAKFRMRVESIMCGGVAFTFVGEIGKVAA